MNGAGLDGVGSMAATHGSLLSPLARAQYVALTELRWRILVNGLHSMVGKVEVGARTFSYAIYTLMGLGLGVGAGASAYALAAKDEWSYCAIVFWVVSMMWQMLPIMLASFQEQFDLSSLLRFPVGFRPFFLLYVVFGLSDLSTILGGLCCAGILIGVTAARPELFVGTALILAVFALFNILLVRAVFAWIDRWLSQRKTREILGAVFMLMVLSLQLLNPAFHQERRAGKQDKARQREMYYHVMASRWMKTAEEVQAFLPPGLAAVALRNLADSQPAPALEAMGILGLFVIGAGGVLGIRLRAEYRGENLGAAPKRKKAVAGVAKAVPAQDASSVVEAEGRFGISGPLAAVMEKELRGLLRSLPQLYAVGAPLVLVLVISGPFTRAGSQGFAPLIAFPLCVFAAQIGFRQLFSNSLGAEGAGIQLYFLAPTPLRTVLLGKNLLHSLVFVVSMIAAMLLATVRLGAPTAVMLAATIAFLLFVLPTSLAIGNIFSLTMPYRINPGRITRQQGSQASALFNLLFQVVTLGVGAAVFELCSLEEKLWLTIPVFLVFAAIATFAWLRILGKSDEIANQRKDQLIATLVKDRD